MKTTLVFVRNLGITARGILGAQKLVEKIAGIEADSRPDRR